MLSLRGLSYLSIAIAAMVNVEAYTEAINVKLTRMHITLPKGQCSMMFRTMLKGMFSIVMTISLILRLAIKILVTVCSLLFL